MPKVYLSRADRERWRAESGNEAIRTAIASYLLKGNRQTDLAQLLGISQPTFSRRLANPETFTLNELRHLISVVGMPEETRHKII